MVRIILGRWKLRLNEMKIKEIKKNLSEERKSEYTFLIPSNIINIQKYLNVSYSIPASQNNTN